MKTFTFSLLLISLMAGIIKAQIINVPDDKTTIQAAIDSASTGDTVLVAEGTYLENINFNGKAITVASLYLTDKDTSHISKTIIDGSNYSDWKRGSTVIMESGEDTTSVLTGFTITGGAGTFFTRDGWKEYYGGGICVMGSGCKIMKNIIEGNHKTPHDEADFSYGGGLSVSVFNNHTAIIRDNIIRKNSITAANTYAGGVWLDGGRIIFENNSITDNTLIATNYCFGAGLFWGSYGSAGVIKEVIIRNNYITRNSGTSPGDLSGGGGIGTGLNDNNCKVYIYNNVISNNSIAGLGGGVLHWAKPMQLYNNTICNNTASDAGNNLDMNSGLAMINNIIWSDVDNNVSDISLSRNASNPIWAYYNILKEPFGPASPVVSKGNLYVDPMFQTNSCELADSSPAIGRGIDSIKIGSTWHFTPVKDFAGNPRPNAIDSYMDLGAYESEYKPITLSIADLSHIGIHNYELSPAFHRDTLDYKMSVHDTMYSTSALQAMPWDITAYVDINHASDLASQDPANRTATITVTSSDSSTHKVYTVLFRYMSSDATLKDLSFGCGVLDPDFNSDTMRYEVYLPHYSTEAPQILYDINDTLSTARLSPISDLKSPDKSKRTAWIVVTAEDGNFQNYGIMFTIIPSCTDCGCAVNTADRLELNKIRIYPNPFNTNLNIDMKNIPPAQKIEILSIDGRIVRILNHLPGNSITIGRENLPGGIYFVRIHSDKTYVRKVVIR